MKFIEFSDVNLTLKLPKPGETIVKDANYTINNKNKRFYHNLNIIHSINPGANDDEILTLKSKDISWGSSISNAYEIFTKHEGPSKINGY